MVGNDLTFMTNNKRPINIYLLYNELTTNRTSFSTALNSFSAIANAVWHSRCKGHVTFY